VVCRFELHCPFVSRRYGVDILVGLQELHARGILVLDLKPHNVLLDELEDGSVRAVLTDFGLSRVLMSEASRAVSCVAVKLSCHCICALVISIQFCTCPVLHLHPSLHPGARLHAPPPRLALTRRAWYPVPLLQSMNSAQGTGPYMAPEQHNPTGRGVTPATDMWGFGATMVHMLSGSAPRVSSGHGPPEIPWQASQVDGLTELLESCFNADPKSRLTVASALETLEGIIAAQVRFWSLPFWCLAQLSTRCVVCWLCLWLL
jgi:serine/threonine protein kinase